MADSGRKWKWATVEYSERLRKIVENTARQSRTVEESEGSVADVRDAGGRSAVTLFLFESNGKWCKTAGTNGTQWTVLADISCSVADPGRQ